MGVYVYKTTPSAVKQVQVQFKDGTVRSAFVQSYTFAYKPYRSVFDGDSNDRMDSRHVEPARRAFAKRGNGPTPFGVLGPIQIGSVVENTNSRVAIYDEDSRERVGTVIGLRAVRAERSVDEIIADRTGFKDLQDMLNTHHTYFPTIRCRREYNLNASARELADLKRIADAYDAAQAARGDQRRAWRG